MTFILFKFIFKEELSVKISERSIRQLLELDEKQVIRGKYKHAALIILMTILGFLISSFFENINFELGYIALAGGFASVALVSSEHSEKALRKIEWSLVFFYSGLLTVVGIVEKAHLLDVVVAPIKFFFGIDLLFGLLMVLFLNTVASSFLDNIPMAAIMKEIIDTLAGELKIDAKPIIWATVVGTNSGGNVTPIASASGVQAVEMLNREKDETRHVSFKDFVKVGILAAAITVIIGSIYVVLLAKFVYWTDKV
jgi:Na+/H+ antiporter NhaD/arsenite permease-like protein